MIQLHWAVSVLLHTYIHICVCMCVWLYVYIYIHVQCFVRHGQKHDIFLMVISPKWDSNSKRYIKTVASWQQQKAQSFNSNRAAGLPIFQHLSSYPGSIWVSTLLPPCWPMDAAPLQLPSGFRVFKMKNKSIEKCGFPKRHWTLRDTKGKSCKVAKMKN